MILGAILIVYLIAWMADKRETSTLIKNKVDFALKKNNGFGLAFLVFISILREGVETTFFLNAIASEQSTVSMLFAILGLAVGLLAGCTVYIGLKGINLRYLFNISSVLLILFATGLFARGVHEFQEVGIIPIFVKHVWSINYLISENGSFGSFMKSLFGYNANPSLIEVSVYIGFDVDGFIL